MSKTEENLKAAFAGESQARNKYTYYAEVARLEGYHYIASYSKRLLKMRSSMQRITSRCLVNLVDPGTT